MVLGLFRIVCGGLVLFWDQPPHFMGHGFS